MTIPSGTFRFGQQCQTPQTRPSYGACPVGSHEAAYAIEVVRQRLIAEAKKPKPFTIKTPKETTNGTDG